MTRGAPASGTSFHKQGLGGAGANFPVELPPIKVHARNLTLLGRGAESEVSPGEPTELRVLACGHLIHSCSRSPAMSHPAPGGGLSQMLNNDVNGHLRLAC